MNLPTEEDLRNAMIEYNQELADELAYLHDNALQAEIDALLLGNNFERK